MTINSDSPAGPPSPTTLADLVQLGRGCVVRVHGADEVADRLRELGLTAGTPVSFVRRAPLGDPLCFRFRGIELCLRRDEARRVEIAVAP